MYPRYVWSPAGGYWNEGPAGSEKRGWMLVALWVVAVGAVSSYSGSHEVRMPCTVRFARDAPTACLPQKLHNPDGREPMPSGLLRTNGREREDRGRA